MPARRRRVGGLECRRHARQNGPVKQTPAERPPASRPRSAAQRTAAGAVRDERPVAADAAGVPGPSASFARTKIRPPRPRGASLIARPALESRLVGALQTHRLVLVCAAAGFGKTSALASLAEALPAGTAFAWVSCDEGDDLRILLGCLVAALEPYDPPWRVDPQALVRSIADAPPPETLRTAAAELINALDATDVPLGVIVLDDLHRVADAAVPAFLDLLLERLAHRWSLAIGSRSAPALATARLRAHHELASFGPEDLRFDAAEARSLASASGIAADEADALLARSEGWPVGLRLALGAGRHAPHAADRHVSDYLASEVIDRLDPALRDFLLRSAVLPELSAARCAAVTGDAAAARRLEDLQREALFVTPLTGPEPTWRLHDLFREALEARLQRERPGEFDEVLVRAAAGEPDPLRRVAFLQRARRWDEAEAALAGAADGLIADGAAAAVRALFEHFPPDYRTRSAPLRLLFARSQWDWDAVLAAMEQAAKAHDGATDAAARFDVLSHQCLALCGANRHERTRALAATLLAEPALGSEALARTIAALSWVEIPRGDQAAIAPLWARGLAALEASDSLALWTECVPYGPFVGLPGMRPLLQRFVDGATRRLPDYPTPLRGLCEVLRAWLAIWGDDVSAARRATDAAVADNRWLARPLILDAPARTLQAVIAAIDGDAAGARDILFGLVDRMRRSRNAMHVEVYASLYLHLAMRCAAATDDTATLREATTALVHEPHADRSWLSPAQRDGADAQLAALDGDLALACRCWQAMLDDARHGDFYGQHIDTRLRLADGLLRLGRGAGEAAAVLAPWFDAAESDGDWGPVRLAGPSLLRRLAAADWGRALAPARRERLRAWAGRPAADRAPETRDLLSARERDVLELIAAGQSNKLIARALELSPHTVKRHVANILDKLALASRGQAAAWYRTNGSEP